MMHPALTNPNMVDINGNPWRPSKEAVFAAPKSKREGSDEFHKGWRVEGHPPGALEEAEKQRGIENGIRKGATRKKVPPAWDADVEEVRKVVAGDAPAEQGAA